jgi:hypothetical protein
MEQLTQKKLDSYQALITRNNLSPDNGFVQAVVQGNKEQLEAYFLESSIHEAKALRTKLNSMIEDVEQNAEDSFDFLFLNSLKESTELTEAYRVLDSYDALILSLLDDVEKNSPNYSSLFPKKIEEMRDAILHLYPQSMSLEHYQEVFELIGYAPNIEANKLSQLTIMRQQAFTNYAEKTKNIEVLESYAFSELSGILREAKIKEIAQEFWSAGRLNNLQFLVEAKGGSLLLDGDKVKVFQIEDPTPFAEKDNFFLIYATPAFYSYTPEKVFNKKIGRFLFLDKNPKLATCIIEVDQVLMRQDFLKSPANTSDMMFKVKVQIPVNLFKFYVKKLKE